MKYNFIGNSGLSVSELCLGTMTFGGQNAGVWESMGKLEQQEVDQLVKIAWEAGINFYDTANIYSFGKSEILLGQAFKNLQIPREQLVIATKVMGKMSGNPNDGGLSRYHIFNSVDASLRRLQVDHIDILYVHGVDAKTSVEAIVHTLNDVVLSGKVRYIAICNWPAWMVAEAQLIAKYHQMQSFIGLQYYYSAITRDIEQDVIPVAQKYQMGVFPWSPLAGGFLTGKYRKDALGNENARRASFDFPIIDKEKGYELIDVLERIAQTYHASVAQTALAWVRQQPGVTSTIIGAKTAGQLEDNLQSIKVVLSNDDLKAIDDVSPLVLQYPAWMVKMQADYKD